MEETKVKQIVKVQYYTDDERLSDRAYTYFSEVPLAVGDIVTVPMRNTTCQAKVCAVDVPETEIAAFRDKVKVIPAPREFGANDLPPMAPTAVANANPEPSSDWREIKPLGKLTDTRTEAEKRADIWPEESAEVKLEPAGDAYMMVGKALIKVQPESDITILSLLAQANQLRDFAIARVIATDNDMSLAVNDLSVIANVKKALTNKKAEYYKPIKAHLDAVSAAFQTLLTPIEDADRITREKWTTYRNEQARRKAEAEAINQAKEELARREAELNHGEITIDLTPVEAPTPIARVQTEMGSAGITKTRKYEVIDFKLLPDDYKIVDAAKLGKVVRAGLDNIPGVRIWTEEGLRVSAK